MKKLAACCWCWRLLRRSSSIRPVASPESGAAVIALPVNRPQMMRATEVMTTVGPGDGQPWAQELAFLWTTLRHRVLDVMGSVLADGFREPIVLGRDGRLWDGHHRLAVALALDLEVPVHIGGCGTSNK